MKSSGRRWLAILAGVAVCLASATWGARAEKTKKAEDRTAQKAGTGEEPTATPESVGFSSAGLERLHALIQGEIDQKELAGAVTILARHGKIVDYRAYGVKDLATGAPMTKDTIFRDYSMTKPTTGVAMMILYQEGKWLPWDPVAKFVPEFKNLKVFAGFDNMGKMILVKPDHAPTMAELMSHTAGFSYGPVVNGPGPLDGIYAEVKPFASANLQEFVEREAKIPLSYQPGQGWLYSASMDIEGAIIEKLSGETLPDFDRQHIFGPLGMTDAGFYVPADKRDRFATNYRATDEERLVPVQAGTGPTDMDYAKEPTMPSGGGGLVSTAMDYYRFAQMLGDGGTLDGQQILSPETVKLMTSNHLGTHLLTGKWGIGQHIMRPGFGYGFNVAVEFNPPEAGLSDGKGTFFWDGAAGTWFWVDPTNDVVFVAMIQRMGGHDNHELEYKSHAAVYGALVNPAK